MATFVLVHPAWFGGWCWSKVTPSLRAGGHTVHTPTLTGLGDRAHLATPTVGLSLHVDDVTNVIEFEALRDVVLVGHSSSGMVITGVAEREPDRIAQVVYLDAFVPADGQSLVDIIPPDRQAARIELLAFSGPGRAPAEPGGDLHAMVTPCPALPASVPGQLLTSSSGADGQAGGQPGDCGGRAAGQVVGHPPEPWQ